MEQILYTFATILAFCLASGLAALIVVSIGLLLFHRFFGKNAVSIRSAVDEAFQEEIARIEQDAGARLRESDAQLRAGINDFTADQTRVRAPMAFP